MKTKLCLPIALIAVLLIGGGFSCSKRSEEGFSEKVPAQTPSESAQSGKVADASRDAKGYRGRVVETMDAGGYTYVLVDTGEERIWAASPQFSVAVGDEASFAAGMPMANFKSETLDRTFDVVYFVSRVAVGGSAKADMADAALPEDHPEIPPAGKTMGAPVTIDAEISGIERAEGGLNIAEIYAQKGALAGSEVLVRGKVVKFNGGIMGRNWLHIQDGSGEPPAHDITVTTQDGAKVGQTVLVRGILTGDRDFGSGYRYSVIIEDASVIIE